MTVYIEDRMANIPLDGVDSAQEEVGLRNRSPFTTGGSGATQALPTGILLRKVNGMRHQEIADHLGITLSAVEKHLRNGTRSCRAYIHQATMHSPQEQDAQSVQKQCREGTSNGQIGRASGAASILKMKPWNG